MKKQMSVWVVSTALMLSIGIMASLSNRANLKAASVEAAPVASHGAGTLEAAAPPASVAPSTAGAASSEASLSPNLMRTDAYKFLDPVPVGHAAPDFSGKSADGKLIKLSSFKGQKNVVIVFYQGSFCTVCGAQLTDFQQHASDFVKQQTQIIAISADDAAHALQSVGEHGLTFPVLPNADKTIIKKYGVANISKQSLAWPALFIVDKKGVIRLSYADKGGNRLHSQDILPELEKINAASAKSAPAAKPAAKAAPAKR